MKKVTRSLLALMIALLAWAVLPRPAGAHPLGNFTINHYTALTVGAKAVAVRYILDMAEIPTFQGAARHPARRQHRSDPGGARRLPGPC